MSATLHLAESNLHIHLVPAPLQSKTFVLHAIWPCFNPRPRRGCSVLWGCCLRVGESIDRIHEYNNRVFISKDDPEENPIDVRLRIATVLKTKKNR
jgi:hypothetical protein